MEDNNFNIPKENIVLKRNDSVKWSQVYVPGVVLTQAKIIGNCKSPSMLEDAINKFIATECKSTLIDVRYSTVMSGTTAYYSAMILYGKYI